MKKIILSMALVLGMAANGWAIPALQLDISGGVYDNSTQTIVATNNLFNLYAFLDPGKGSINDTFKISAALIPSQGMQNPAPSLGSFSFNGQTVNVTGDMNYGTPPVESLAVSQPFDSGDLSKHDIFPTYFKEFEFTFSGQQVPKYNTQDKSTEPGSMYAMMFNVDLSSLASGYGIHFDLYNTKLAKKSTTDLDVNLFAPYSHDAEGMHRNPPSVPEPGTILLLGSGLVGLAGMRRKFKV